MQFADLALGEGHELDTGEGELLVEPGDVLLIAAQAIEPLGKDDIERPSPSILQEFLVSRPERRGATHRVVGAGADELPALSFNVSLAGPDLILDGRIPLVGG